MLDNYFISKVDSTKLSIPLIECDIIDRSLKDYFEFQKINLTTGEKTIISQSEGEPFILDTEVGIFYKIWIEPQIISKGLSVPFLSVLVNSKHIGPDYFNGITKETLKQLHTNIMALEVFKCSFESFYNARYHDTDIAFDFQCNEANFKLLKDNIIASTLPQLVSTWSRTDTATNSGIWTPKTPKNIKPREFATPSKPYIKFYSKEIDFKFRSREFADYYDLHDKAKDVVRFEATIKNARHKKLLKIDHIKSIGQLLDTRLNLIASDMFRRYFEKRKFVKTSNLTPMDKLISGLVNELINEGVSKERIFAQFDRKDVTRKSNHNLVKKYHSLYMKNEIDKQRLEANEISKSVFQYLGVSEQLKINLGDKES